MLVVVKDSCVLLFPCSHRQSTSGESFKVTRSGEKILSTTVTYSSTFIWQ